MAKQQPTPQRRSTDKPKPPPKPKGTDPILQPGTGGYAKPTDRWP